MKTPVLMIRVFYSELSGLGHVYRSTAILECAVRDGWHVIVISDQPISKPPIASETVQWYTLGKMPESQIEDAKACIALCNSIDLTPSLTWLDHYGLDKPWETEISKLCPVSIIDDLCRTHHANSILVDYFPNRTSQQLNHNSSKSLIGLRYLLLRENFREPIRTQPNNPKQKILVQFGGGDRIEYDLAVLQAMHEDLDLTGEITWLQGDQTLLGFWHRQDLVVNTLEQCNNMALLYEQHQVALGASGVAMWERLAVSLESIVWQVADNQNENFNAVAGWEGIETVDQSPTKSTDVWLSLLKVLLNKKVAFKSSIDVYGANRIWRAIVPHELQLSETIKFEKFSEELVRDLYELQCIPGIRSHSRNTEIPSWNEHKVWSNQLLNSAVEDGWLITAPMRSSKEKEFNSNLSNRKPLGWLKLSSINADGYREISLLVDPEYHAMGVGYEILEFAKHSFNNVCGYVQNSNIASNKLFSKAGFKKHDEWYLWSNAQTEGSL